MPKQGITSDGTGQNPTVNSTLRSSKNFSHACNGFWLLKTTTKNTYIALCLRDGTTACFSLKVFYKVFLLIDGETEA